MVRAVRVAIFSQCYVLVSMHDLYLPVISIEPQDGFWCRSWHAGYQVCDFRFVLGDLARPNMLAITGDARDAANCGPCIAPVFAERVGCKDLNLALINSSVTGLWLFLPLREAEKPAP